MWDFVFSAQFITGLFVGANCALLAFALCYMSKKTGEMNAKFAAEAKEKAMDKSYNEWIKNTPR